MTRRDWLLRWIGPGVLLLTVLAIWQIVVSPVVADLQADWAFLHAARAQAIQQQIQQQSRKPSP